jgi:hypothetical protein
MRDVPPLLGIGFPLSALYQADAEQQTSTPAKDQDAAERSGYFLNHYKSVIGTVDDLPADAAFYADFRALLKPEAGT